MNSEKIIEMLGGPSEVARLCECSPQAVSQWFGVDPATGFPREIPNARLLFLRAVRPDVFTAIAKSKDVPSAAPQPEDPALAADMVKLEQAGIVKLPKAEKVGPRPPGTWDGITEDRVALDQRRAVDRARDAKLVAYEAKEAGQGA